MLTHRSYRGFNMMGRLRAGVTVKQAQAELDTIMRDLERAYPDTNKDATAYVRKEMDRRLIGNGVLLPSILMALVLLVLLIACANVASLLMARATSRMREISTQLAIGATRAALVRQLLTESAVLAFLGGISGIVLGFGCIQGFMALLPYTPSPSGPAFHLDVRVLGFALLVSTAAVFLCGLAPAFLTIREAMASVTTNVRADFRQPHFRHAGAAHSDCRANRIIDDPADWRRTVSEGVRQNRRRSIWDSIPATCCWCRSTLASADIRRRRRCSSISNCCGRPPVCRESSRQASPAACPSFPALHGISPLTVTQPLWGTLRRYRNQPGCSGLFRGHADTSASRQGVHGTRQCECSPHRDCQ